MSKEAEAPMDAPVLHEIVDRDGNPMGEPYPTRRAALMEALYKNGMAGKPLYEVRRLRSPAPWTP